MVDRSASTRRDVLLRVLSAVPCCSACAGQAAKHKFGQKYDIMTWEEVFRFFYSGTIRYMKGVAGEIGREKLVEILLATALPPSPRTVDPPRKYLAASFKQFKAAMKGRDPWTEFPITREYIEESDRVLAYNTTECLWAKIFREADAGDIGYAMICHPDFAKPPRINPRIKLVRTKTLMQGHDCCNFRWEWSETLPS